MTEDALPEQVRVRREKYDRLVAAGVEPYPVGYPRTTSVAALRERHPDLGPDERTGEVVGVCGRVVLSRIGGRLCFATICEGDATIQLMVSEEGVGADRLADWKSDVDLGDHVGVTGEVVSSRRGELSVLASSWQLTAKALRPLPDKHKGLADPEARVRQRYLDLLVNPSSRAMLYQRAAVTHSVRTVLHQRGFVEAETPVLQVVHGGAAARPFRTHVNALDLDVTLRIALELPLKKLVVGGIDRVYEIGRIFRNEGIDASHFPEFTMVEAYQTYGDYETVAELTQAMVLAAAEVLGVSAVAGASLAGEWRRASLFELVGEAVGEQLDAGTPVARLRQLAAAHQVELQPDWDAGEVTLELYEKLVERTLLAPTFVRDYPASVRPLARVHRADPRLVEAWDLVVGGVELAAGYSELVDPVEQRRRLVAQSLRAAAGDPEAMGLDEDFLRALEHGMPPTGGMGMGIDRLVMLLLGVPVRDTIAFPLVRPESG